MEERLSVIYQLPTITFDRFPEYREMAVEIAERVKHTIVTEETVKEAKRDIAEARKLTDALNRRRIDIKKELLRPYETFESQVKELVEIIDEADRTVRSQVREIEEKEREEKREVLRDIWEKRIGSYTFPVYVIEPFDAWLNPKYLNKTFSITRSESEMVEWMETVESEVEALEKMDDSVEILVEYGSTLDALKSIETVRARQERADAIAETKKTEETAVFVISGKANIKLAEMLLRENGISYERK